MNFRLECLGSGDQKDLLQEGSTHKGTFQKGPVKKGSGHKGSPQKGPQLTITLDFTASNNHSWVGAELSRAQVSSIHSM